MNHWQLLLWAMIGLVIAVTACLPTLIAFWLVPAWAELIFYANLIAIGIFCMVRQRLQDRNSREASPP